MAFRSQTKAHLIRFQILCTHKIRLKLHNMQTWEKNNDNRGRGRWHLLTCLTCAGHVCVKKGETAFPLWIWGPDNFILMNASPYLSLSALTIAFSEVSGSSLSVHKQCPRNFAVYFRSHASHWVTLVLSSSTERLFRFLCKVGHY